MKFSIVMVVWDDATELDGWTDGDEEIKPCLVYSVGYLVRKTKDHIVLAQDIAADGMQCGRGQIPRGMVRKITTLRKP
jgi:hypothetical protein